MRPRSKRLSIAVPWLAALSLYSILLLVLLRVHHTAAASEPDQYYHLAMARMMAESGLVDTLPQADNMAWKEKFTNLYFLFTAITAAAWKIGGETATRAVSPLLTLALLLLLFAFCRRYLDWRWAVFLPVVLLLLNPATFSRYIHLRPSVLAECLVVGMMLAIVSGNRYALLACAFLFPLSYHAIHVPVAVLGGAAAVGYFFDKDTWPREALFGFGALALGFVCNPYFPETVAPLTAVFSAVSKSGVHWSDAPMEIFGWDRERFFGRVPFFGFALGAAAWIALAKPKKKWDRSEFFFLFGLAAGFSALLFVSYRAIEYAGPMMVILCALVMSRLAQSPKELGFLLATAVLVSLPESARLFRQPLSTPVDPVSLRAAIESIPRAEGKKVFNCDWSSGGPLLYMRPDLKFIDLGDPTAMDSTSRVYRGLRTAVIDGNVPYVFGPVRHAFQADYVFCQNRPLLGVLERDPHFRRIYPADPAGLASLSAEGYAVYEVASARHAGFVSELEKRGSMGMENLRTSQTLPEAQRSPFFSLPAPPGERAISSETKNCEQVAIPRAEMARRQGAQFLGLGGGPEMRVEWNGKALFRRHGASPTRSLDVLIPLPRPLAASDRIEIRVCPGWNLPQMGIAVSLWKSSEIKEACRWKGAADPQSAEVPFSERPAYTCLGAIASPARSL